MLDLANGVPIVDHSGRSRDQRWLRDRYGDSPRVTVRPPWRLACIWEQSGPLTCGVRLMTLDRQPITGLPVFIGWPGVRIETVSRAEMQRGELSGWVDVPIAGGEYDPTIGQRGPMYIEAADGSWRYEGIGWRVGTNHDHLCVDLVRGEAGAYQPPAPSPPAAGELVDTTTLRYELERARDAIERALGRLP